MSFSFSPDVLIAFSEKLQSPLTELHTILECFPNGLSLDLIIGPFHDDDPCNPALRVWLALNTSPTCAEVSGVLYHRQREQKVDVAVYGLFDLCSSSRLTSLLIESSALHALSLLILLIYLVHDDLTSLHPQVILSSITGIAPTLIVARVASGQARLEDPRQSVTTRGSSVYSRTARTSLHTSPLDPERSYQMTLETLDGAKMPLFAPLAAP
ncbi:uncharacterized protein BT62DRAFT_999371 [Guyanagaster necrorhizus]|uniref:Uncharacterized protein n=1 Tax=Guyanagaster necrorhizus TaxID=856835 RepID=A0A9P8AXK3_9AGAR|nr:uncharacterized protein BT62DRAFT_999371 [Guyanagaster necrorhizus MCA 3950]KAG7451698.1 hypothetical protein BT62DRAFT_999371 [Guyanagaster necrorhizus MCA 3950]